MSTVDTPQRTPAPWVFLTLIGATALAAAISLSMIAAPEMLASHDGAGLVRFFLAVGAVYLGMPITWLLGVSVIATYPRQNKVWLNRTSAIAAFIWTALLAVPYVIVLSA